MQRISYVFFIIIFAYFSLPPLNAYAIENPLTRPNNKMGIHILFDSELPQAAQLINSSGGDWGYVTIPIQSGDKDLIKWQKFMDSAKQNHVIPIFRLATQGDYFNTKVWRKPAPADIMDFANFLNSLNWPVKNKYVIIFNEVNRGDEWGGSVNPAEYAELLSFAVSVFKSKSQDFYVISSGMDNAAPNQAPLYMSQYNYMQQMNTAVPGIFNQVDGLASHSYPNPGFAQPPSATSIMGVGSFVYESQLAKSMSGKDLPVFITETGWSTNAITDDTIAHYYQQTMQTIWNDKRIVAITPFLLQGSGGPFQQFSLFDGGNHPTLTYQMLKSLPKNQGYPSVQTKTAKLKVLAASTTKDNRPLPPVRDFSKVTPQERKFSLSLALQNAFKWIMGI